jgi:septal ring factor EnvC (AmiA/AmiB activator)
MDQQTGTPFNSSQQPEEQSGVKPWVVWVLAAGLVFALGFGFYQQNLVSQTRAQVAQLQGEIAKVNEAVLATDGKASQRLALLAQEIEESRQEQQQSVQQAQKSAAAAAARQANLAAAKVRKQIAEEQAEQDKALEARLSEIKSGNEQASARLTDITEQVSSVKTDVASTRSEVERIAADLKRTTGDMGIMSGLIATNAKELAALRELGERDYIEFRLNRSKEMQRVGDVMVKLKKADAKRNRFSLDLVADDKKTEKKDRTINEPVQFYVLSKARQPYELVVNEVKRDEVVGYLAVPKFKLAARK